jgi:hypothetical protein
VKSYIDLSELRNRIRIAVSRLARESGIESPLVDVDIRASSLGPRRIEIVVRQDLHPVPGVWQDN